MKNRIGYKDSAIIYTLEDIKLQEIRVKLNSKKVITSSFIGSGQQSQSQTLEIATKDKLVKEVKAGESRCFFDGDFYIITGISKQSCAPIFNKRTKNYDTIIYLQ